MSLKTSTLIILLALIGKISTAQTASSAPVPSQSTAGVVRFPSQKDLKTFDLIKYDHYNFYVPTGKQAAFFVDLAKNEALFGDIKFVQAGEQTYTAEEWIATQLLADFYGRDLTGEPR
jgi:hypothetical protein